ncbi:papain family cysteine protease, partial [Ostertagia ostertagi]
SKGSIEYGRLGQYISPNDFGAWNQFTDFIERYGKAYSNESEALKRFRIFKKNLEVIRNMQENEQGTAVYGITRFSDLSPEEFKKIYLPYTWKQPNNPKRIVNLVAEGVDPKEPLPKSFDWRKHGAVTEVKDQVWKLSCWAFSVTGNIEGQWYLAKKELVSLSEQQLLDCDTVDWGCNGGLPINAYQEIIRMGGLESEDDTRTKAKEEQCHLIRSNISVYINDSVELPHDEEQMKAWVFKKGPISIGINADYMMFYQGGISHPRSCNPAALDHGVLLVGYGVEKKMPYWIIKNSWGSDWGEKGYYR